MKKAKLDEWGPWSVPWEDLDMPIRPLVAVLNQFEAITTLGSCAGHKDPDAHQHPEGRWFITFRVSHTAAGWRALEFLSSCLEITAGNDAWDAAQVRLEPAIFHDGAPGRRLYWALLGNGHDPVEFAEELMDKIVEGYAPAPGEEPYERPEGFENAGEFEFFHRWVPAQA